MNFASLHLPPNILNGLEIQIGMQMKTAVTKSLLLNSFDQAFAVVI